jgi:hypothetical protein
MQPDSSLLVRLAEIKGRTLFEAVVFLLPFVVFRAIRASLSTWRERRESGL